MRGEESEVYLRGHRFFSLLELEKCSFQDNIPCNIKTANFSSNSRSTGDIPQTREFRSPFEDFR